MADDSAAETVLSWCAKTTRSVVEQASAASERGVLEVGRALGVLVEESRSQTSDLLEVLPRLEGDGAAHESSISIRDAIDRQTATVTTFAEQLISRAGRQNEIAEHASKLTEGIAHLARDVSSIAVKARLLSLNARIECSRLGEQGKAMTVVANEIRQVSASVAKANADISELAGQLTELLPAVARLSAELQTSSQQFRESFEQSQSETQATYSDLMTLVRSTVERSQTRAERMLSEAQDALSALNFQDPMAQQLRELAAKVEARCGNASAYTDGSPSSSSKSDDSNMQAGEVALF
ncbi:MAG TPA: methyl-accepting chemotaxis protein [Polyangiaceae bacterium]|nr:methyl-accepting chemotaxis protein [Polyangiaceae bacterium]